MGSSVSTITSGLGLVNTLTGGALPFVSTIGQIASGVSGLQSARAAEDSEAAYYAQQDQALAQLQEQQALEQQQVAQNAALEKQKIAVQAAQSEEQRRAALKRAVAMQRAVYGASGVGSNGGSSEAVLLGLYEESDGERQKREQLDALKATAIDNDLAQKSSLNLLQATQLAERNNLKRYYA